MKALVQAIAICGSQSALAFAIDVKQPTVSEWLRGDRPIPLDRCHAIERATKGVVTCEELRPDVTWHRIPDKKWSWHKKGRPAHDLTVSMPEQSEPAEQGA
ncbi:MAG: helix-turn-helix domain-containing protein [Methylibium sp.]|nr:helix-turn-helix domain-containing protein [Methylibium sp.]